MYDYIPVVITLSLPTRSMGRLRAALLESRTLCVDREGVTAQVVFMGCCLAAVHGSVVGPAYQMVTRLVDLGRVM